MSSLYERAAALADVADVPPVESLPGAADIADDSDNTDLVPERESVPETPERTDMSAEPVTTRERSPERGRRSDPRAAGGAGRTDDERAGGSDPTPRRSTVQQALGGQSTAMRAAIALGAVSVLGVLYLFTPVFGGHAPVREEPMANPLVSQQRIGTGLMVAALRQDGKDVRDPIFAATAPDVALLPDVQSTNGDIEGLLSRLDERQTRLDATTENLNEAERARDAARGDVDRLNAELNAVRLQAATERKTHEAEVRRLKQQQKLDVSRAVAEALARMPTYRQPEAEDAGLSPEELRILEERRRLRAAQLRSKSIVYDGITD